MAIGEGETILASDIQAIKDDIGTITSASSASVSATETTTSTTATNLTTVGPVVTLTTGTMVLVAFSAQISNSDASEFAICEVEVSGATTRATSNAEALMYESSNATNELAASRLVLMTGLTAGSNTFTMKYRVTAGTGTFRRRNLIVIPIGA